MRTVAWSPRVGTVWTRAGNPDVEVTGEHVEAGLIKLGDDWVAACTLDDYTQACCPECGEPLSAMRRLLMEEAERNTPPRYVKAKPGTYCTKSCCWPPHAPPGC